MRDLQKAARLGEVSRIGSTDSNFFATDSRRIEFIDLINKAIKTEAVPGRQEDISIDFSFDKKFMSWSWQRFQDISPKNPSLNHLIKPFFIYQNNCLRYYIILYYIGCFLGSTCYSDLLYYIIVHLYYLAFFVLFYLNVITQTSSQSVFCCPSIPIR